MNWKAWKQRIISAVAGNGASFVSPSFVLEIEPGFVLGAQIDRSARRLRHLQVRELEPHALEPVLNQPNVKNPEALETVTREIAQLVGAGTGRLGLLVPDPAVRVATLSFETLPDDRHEVDALIRWRMKELFPFAPEEARLSYQLLRREPDSIEFLAMAAKNNVLSEYERAVDHLNGGSALTLPATAALLSLLPEQDGAGQLLIHVCCGWMTTVVVTGSRLRSWRTRDLSRVAPSDVAREVAREAARAEASARDCLKVDMARVWLSSRPPAREELTSELARAVSSGIEILAPESGMGAGLPATEGALLQSFGATVAGLVSNSP